MRRILLFLVSLYGAYFTWSNESDYLPSGSGRGGDITDQDTITRNQLLYNGRIWRNTYTGVKGDAYLFSKEFLNGSVTINGKRFNNIRLLFDIHKDELLTVSGRNIIILLNKEMVNSFEIGFNNRTYRFVNNSSGGKTYPEGYSNALYEGITGIYVKYRKVIDPRAVENRYDAFRQLHRIYVIRDSVAIQVNSKGQFFKLFTKEETRNLKAYLNKERLRISAKDPDSFVPVARYYDDVMDQKR